MASAAWALPCPLPDVRAAQCLRRSAIFNDQLERIIFVANDLLVLQQLEKTVIRHVFNRLHPAPVKEHRHRNQTESDDNENDAAPIKIRFAPAVFVFSLRVAIKLSYKPIYVGKKLSWTTSQCKTAGQADVVKFVNCQSGGWVIGTNLSEMVTALVSLRVIAHQLHHLLRVSG